MKKIYLIPRTGLSVPDPEARDHLPPGGREVKDSPYWRRRLRDREVSVGEAGLTESFFDSKPRAKSKAKTGEEAEDK